MFVAVAVFGIWLLRRLVVARQPREPLPSAPDDPLMQAAFAHAKTRLPQFKTLLAQPYQEALVKLRFASEQGDAEYLWAQVLRQLDADTLEVELTTLPETPGATDERRQQVRFEALEDWQVTDPAGKIHGGYSQRAMFAMARRDGQHLPARLLAHEKDYLPD